MANTEIFLRNIFGTTRPNIRPLVLALNITNDLLFEQHISIADNAWIGVGTSTPRSSTPGKNQHSIFLTRMMF